MDDESEGNNQTLLQVLTSTLTQILAFWRSGQKCPFPTIFAKFLMHCYPHLDSVFSATILSTFPKIKGIIYK